MTDLAEDYKMIENFDCVHAHNCWKFKFKQITQNIEWFVLKTGIQIGFWN